MIATYLRHQPATPTAVLDHLTDRERDVLRQIGLGRSNTEIAAEFVVSENPRMRQEYRTCVLYCWRRCRPAADPGAASPAVRRRHAFTGWEEAAGWRVGALRRCCSGCRWHPHRRWLNGSTSPAAARRSRWSNHSRRYYPAVGCAGGP
ncbi:MAG: LuxR C-terminal-related transcriptional regulator [Pseudonocardiaceae bacterium]